MSKFAIVLCTLLFASAVNATLCRFIRRHGQCNSIQVINAQILRVNKMKEASNIRIQQDKKWNENLYDKVINDNLYNTKLRIHEIIGNINSYPSDRNDDCASDFKKPYFTFRNTIHDMLSCVINVTNIDDRRNNNVLMDFNRAVKELNNIRDMVRHYGDNVCNKHAENEASLIVSDLNSYMEDWNRNHVSFMKSFPSNVEWCAKQCELFVVNQQMASEVRKYNDCVLRRNGN